MRRSIDNQLHESSHLLRRSLQWLKVNHPIESEDGRALRELLIKDIEKHLNTYSEREA